MKKQIIETSGTPAIGRTDMKTTKKGDTLESLEIGQTVYTVPWAYNPMSEDLNLNHSFTESPDGTCAMPVTKTENGYHIDFNFDYFGEKYIWEI